MKVCLELIPDSIQCIKMTDKEYFSDKYKDYISNSKLSLINPEQDGSPEKYRKGFQGDFNESFDLGSAVHGRMLQPEEFEIPEIYKPSGKLGLFTTEVYRFRQEGYNIKDSIDKAKDSANYYKNSFTENRIKNAIKEGLPFYLQRMKFQEDPVKVPLFLSRRNADRYRECIKSIESDEEMMSYLKPKGLLQDPEVFNEYAILAKIKLTSNGEEHIFKVKAKLDNFTINHEMEEIHLNDLKTSSRPVAWFMGSRVDKGPDVGHVWINGAFENFHYYRQSAFYLWLLQGHLRNKYPNYTYKTNFLVVQTTPDYRCRVVNVPNKWVQEGVKEFKHLINLIANDK